MTKYEKMRVEAMLKLGCVCCAQLGIVFGLVENHHLLDGYRRMGHWYTLPLCAGHHRGVWTPEQIECIPAEKRVAISDGRKLFIQVYGHERSLWEAVQKRLRLPRVWPASKIVPRSVA